MRKKISILKHKLKHRILLFCARCFYKRQPVHRITVTGTNGKTSFVHYLSQCWKVLGHSWSTVGTLGYQSSQEKPCEEKMSPAQTTPYPYILNRLLHKAAQDHKSTHFAMEASSRGLHEHHLRHLTFQWGIWTSFSQDHLNYHGTMADYWNAKMKLLSHLTQGIIAHEDLAHLEILRTKARSRGLLFYTYGKRSPELCYKVLSIYPSGRDVSFSIFSDQWKGFLPFISDFQCENVLAALAIISLTEGRIKEVFPYLSHFSSPPGRMEHAKTTPQGAEIYIDYAHTPDAIEQSLKALRPHTQGRLGLVFGCAGGKDTSKRKLMGLAAARYADWAIISDNDPGQENPENIFRMIREGCPDGIVIQDRNDAIAHAISLLKKGDTLLLAGKGHENYQILAQGVCPFSDKDAIAKALALLS